MKWACITGWRPNLSEDSESRLALAGEFREEPSGRTLRGWADRWDTGGGKIAATVAGRMPAVQNNRRTDKLLVAEAVGLAAYHLKRGN